MRKLRDHSVFFLASTIFIVLILACGNKKDVEVTKEETKKESTKEESTGNTSASNQLYFVEQYTSDGQEVGKSSKFYIKSKGGYITAMLKTAQPIGVGSVDVRLERETLNGTEIVDTQPYNVSPDNDYFYFDKITFYKSGDYKVTVFKKDGTPIASGKVEIEFE